MYGYLVVPQVAPLAEVAAAVVAFVRAQVVVHAAVDLNREG